MVDTPRTLAALQTLFADNVSGDISPQDLRDYLVTALDPKVINVKSRGAIGDGVADDQPAVATAITNAGVGGTVYFPPGTYLLTAGGLTISNANVTLILSRGAEIKLNDNTTFISITGDDVSVFGGFWNGNSAQTGSKSIFSITGDKFLLENAVVSGGVHRHVNLSGSSNSIIRGNRITAAGASNGGSAIFITGRTGPVNARNNLIEGNYIFQTAGSDSDTIQGHSTVASSDLSGLRIIGNHIENGSNDFGIEIGGFGGGRSSGVIVSNNRIVRTANGFGGISLDNVDNYQVNGNNIDYAGFTGSIGGIELIGVNRGVANGNVILGQNGGAGGGGIILGNDNETTNDNVISNNVIDGFANGAADGGIDVNMSNSGELKRNIVIGNVVRFPTNTNAGVVYTGIKVRDANASADVTDNMVIGNIIFGNGDTAIQGISIAQNTGINDRTTVMFNHIHDTNQGIRRSAGANDAVIIGNRFTGVTTEYSGSRSGGEIIRTPDGGSDIITLDNNATPTVAGVALAKTGGTTTITDFDDGVVGQSFTLRSDHAVTITDGTNILLNGSANFVMAVGDTLTLSMINDQVWEEVARKTN